MSEFPSEISSRALASGARTRAAESMPRSSGTWVRAAGQSAAEVLWPTRCIGCNALGDLLCPGCRLRLPWIDQRWACPDCGAPFGYLACALCDHDWEMRSTICACTFSGLPARIATIYKDHHERRLAGVMAAAMACALDEAASWPAADGRPRFDPVALDALCFVPATPTAYARRGFDHMELVTRWLSRFLGLPLLDCLVRDDARDQRGLGREDREANLADTLGLVEDVRGLRLLLADDVVTTGASLRASARALLDAGAAEVTCCAFARVW